MELRLSRRDRLSHPSVMFCYGDEISRTKYRRYSMLVWSSHLCPSLLHTVSAVICCEAVGRRVMRIVCEQSAV